MGSNSSRSSGCVVLQQQRQQQDVLCSVATGWQAVHRTPEWCREGSCCFSLHVHTVTQALAAFGPFPLQAMWCIALHCTHHLDDHDACLSVCHQVVVELLKLLYKTKDNSMEGCLDGVGAPCHFGLCLGGVMDAEVPSWRHRVSQHLLLCCCCGSRSRHMLIVEKLFRPRNAAGVDGICM